MSAALKELGTPVVNALPLPGEFLNLGFGKTKDTISHLICTAFPTDRSAYETWLEEVPFVVLCIMPTAFSKYVNLCKKPRYCAVGGPGSGGDTCPMSVREEWFKESFSVLEDDKEKGHVVFLGCDDGHSFARQRASCKPSECNGDTYALS